MKIALLAAGLVAFATLTGCCCDDCKEDKQASLGSVSTENCAKSCSEKAACTAEKGSMGAVGEKKSGCCAGAAATCTEKKTN
jgi:hypothetical protein